MTSSLDLGALSLQRVACDETPRWLRRMRKHRALKEMAEKAKVSSSTILRWETALPAIGAPWAAKSPLYPFPLDLWDIWAFQQEAPRQNAIHPTNASLEEGLRKTLIRWRCPGATLSLHAVGLPKLPSGVRFSGRPLPDTTRTEANGFFPYPHAWRALDRLAGADDFFLISVLRFSQELGTKLDMHTDILRARLHPRLDRTRPAG